ncbi:MAG: VanZ family protein [Bacteroidales bacterium]|nr:VanZ family protein [Bacteroidales bacterium]
MGIKILRYTPTLLWFGAILFASFMPSQHLRQEWFLFPNEDKVIHAIMYFGLALLFLLNSRKSFSLTKRFIIISVISICLIGGVIELLQPILGNRTCDFPDFVANSTGAVLAGGVVWILGKTNMLR